jgi:hypothetical protein
MRVFPSRIGLINGCLASKLKRFQVYHDRSGAKLASCGDMETLNNKREHGGHKETLTNKRQRRSDSPAAVAPRWLILNSCIDDEGGDSSVNTKVASCTSLGEPFSISFGIAAPPACCTLHFGWLGGGAPRDSDSKHTKSEPSASSPATMTRSSSR